MDAAVPVATFAEPPRLSIDPSGRAPLSAVIEFATAEPSVADILVDDGAREWSVPTSDQLTVSHRHVVLGLRPAREHRLRVIVRNRPGEPIKDEWTQSFRTDPLPEDFPSMIVRVSEPAKMEPGVTVFGLRKSTREGAANYGYLVALDHAGEVVWLYHAGHTVGDVKRLGNGNLIYLTFDNRAIELDMTGNVVAQWYAAARWPEAHSATGAIPVEAEAFHHEIFEMPNGNFLTLSVETRTFDDFPSSETDPSAPGESAEVVGDVVVEFSRDGVVVETWRLLDILDPHRIGYGSLGEYWSKKGIPGSRDWSHANAVVYDPDEDSLIVSLRHQDAVVSINRTTGALDWILGPHDGWAPPWNERLLEPVGKLDWQYHQHNARLTRAGTLLLFDNGNFRARPPHPKRPPEENYSRAVEYAIDGERGTVRQVWSFGGPGRDAYYCPFICGASDLPVTGNVLINFGGLMSDGSGKPSEVSPDNFGWVRMVEVTHDDEPRVVFELFIDDRAAGRGWDVYRAERLPGLYP